MSDDKDWKPTPEDNPAGEGAPAVVEEAPPISEGMKGFIAETKELFDKLPAEVKPTIAEPAVPKSVAEPVAPVAPKQKEDSGFIKDMASATPEEYQKRIAYLYSKTKENERLWAEARDFQKKQADELERLRQEQKKRDLALSERELDAAQLRVVDLLDRNSPNYNPAEGAKALRELTQRDNALRQEKEDEAKRIEAVKVDSETAAHETTLLESKKVIDEWASTRAYAQPGHSLFPHLQAWLKKAYETAPEHVTVQDIVEQAQRVFDAHVAKATRTPAGPAHPGGNGAARSNAPGAGGEKLTVSAVLGTGQNRGGAPADPGAKLSAQQRTVAERLFYDPEKGVTKAQAYAMYAAGL